MLLLLTACTLPDEVGVGANTSQYDFLGGDGTAPYFETTKGEGFGLSAWGVWKLRPQKIELVQGEQPWHPPHDVPSTVVNIPMAGEAKDMLDRGVDAAKAVDEMGAGTKWLIGCIFVGTALALLFSKSIPTLIGRLLPRKKSKP